MNAAILLPVARFIDNQGRLVREDLYHLVGLLEQRGNTLSMPYAKPIGRGLWELRRTERPQMRILYGFCSGSAVLLTASKKQRPTISISEIELAHRRLREYCK